MDKYAPLNSYLGSRTGASVRLTFAEIERLLGDRLPVSAHNHRAWWGNQQGGRRVQAEAWLAAGWRVGEVNLEARHVRFVRN
jgi:hypothetical protein